MPSGRDESLLKLLDRLQIALGVLFGLLALFLAIRSIGFRIQHDLPMVLYPGWLFLSGAGVPYKDIFDINMPGSFLLYGLLAKLFGTSDIAFRVFDILLFTLICVLTRKVFAQFSLRSHLFGFALFALLYFGPQWWWLSLQREVFLLALILMTCLCFQKDKPFLAGMGIGLSLLIKPQIAVVYLGIALWARAAIRLPLCLIGIFVPLALTVTYIYFAGALPSWIQLIRDYLPLYAQIGGDIKVMEPGDRLRVIAFGLVSAGGFFVAALIAIASFAKAWFERNDAAWNKELKLLAVLLIATFILPAFSAQFWLYHWLPFLFFVCLTIGLAMDRVTGSETKQAIGLVTFAAAVVIASQYFAKPAFLKAFADEPKVKQGRVDAIIEYLQPRLQQGDLVQPLDWTGGAIHAMYILHARLATRYMQDYYFYHHVSNPTIQAFRKDFIEQMNKQRPRFIIAITSEDKPWPSGRDTTRSFPELQALIQLEYDQAASGEGYAIYERKKPSEH